jgi:hypothetical protein
MCKCVRVKNEEVGSAICFKPAGHEFANVQLFVYP